jgi:hypothetical protein
LNAILGHSVVPYQGHWSSLWPSYRSVYAA